MPVELGAKGNSRVSLLLLAEQLELAMKVGQSILHQQVQQVEPQNYALALRRRRPTVVGVVRPQARQMPLKRALVAHAHRQQHGVLENLAGQGALRLGRRRVHAQRRQRVQLDEHRLGRAGRGWGR